MNTAASIHSDFKEITLRLRSQVHAQTTTYRSHGEVEEPPRHIAPGEQNRRQKFVFLASAGKGHEMKGYYAPSP